MPDISIRVLHTPDIEKVYCRMEEEGLLWTLWPQFDPQEWTKDRFMRLTDRDGILTIGAIVNNDIGGFMQIWPYCGSPYTQVGEVGVCAFRDFFSIGPQMCRHAIRWVFDNLECACLVGHVSIKNRAALNILEKSGFKKICQLPKLGYDARKKIFFDQWFVMADKLSINNKE